MTPESSEQPRETRDGMPLVERFDGLAAIQPQGLNDKTIGELQRIDGKVSSPELASLAAKYIDIDLSEAVGAAVYDGDRTALQQIERDVRALAASVLAQAEGNPRR